MENNNRIGALWLKKSSKGLPYMSGNVEIDGKKTFIAIFKNDKGDNEKRPDYTILKSEPRDQQKSATQAVKETFEDVPF